MEGGPLFQYNWGFDKGGGRSCDSVTKALVKHEDSSSMPRTYINKLAVVVNSGNLSSADSRGLEASQTTYLYLASSRPWENLSHRDREKKGGQDLRNSIQGCPVASVCKGMSVCIHTCTCIHTYMHREKSGHRHA